MIKEHKKELVIVGLILLLIIALVGVSYAAFSYSKLGTKVNTITTGSITMSYEETDNTISLSGALPTTDKTGKTRLTDGEYFDFTVSSSITGNVNINYEISAKDVTTSDRKIDGSNIKLYLTELVDGEEKELMTPEVYNEETSPNTYTGRPANEMSLYTSSMNSSEEHQYRLRMYVDESYNPQGDGGGLTFSVKINVYGKDGLSMEDRMMRVAGSEDFHSSEYKEKITSIVTKGDTIIPEGVVESWDISEKQNGSVIAYAEDDGTGAGTYKVTIGGEGSIIANYDMSSYFSFFTNCSSVDLSYLDTSLTTDMNMLFTMSIKIQELDLSSFDTTSVTNMNFMFSGNFVDGTSMTLREITFGENFDTSNVTKMSYMFAYCGHLTNLDLSIFNTSNVTAMEYMFNCCYALVELNLASFDTKNVTSMAYMFNNCYALTKLDLTSFDTSSVINYSNMFRNVNQSSLSSILVTAGKWTIPNSTITNAVVTDFTYV